MDITELSRSSSNSVIRRHPWEIARAKAILFFIKKQRRVLGTLGDVGSGDGFVLHKLIADGIAKKYFAIDTAYTSDIVRQLNPDLQSNADFFPTIADADERHLTADYLLLTDVLEHCEHDVDVLRSLVSSQLMDNNSLLLITVPAYQRLFSHHDKLLHHHRRYSRQQIIATCRAADLEVMETGYFFCTLLLPRLVQKIFERLGLYKPSKTIDNWTGSKFITRLISFILWIDFRACYALAGINIHLPGLSCYVVCKKAQS